MKKKLVAVAVAGALGVPAVASAQTSTVNIYGTARVEYGYVDPGDGLRKFDGFSVYDSFLGFRGEEKLGGGLSAWFQCESTMDVTGQEGFDNGFCTRNSGLGLKGAFGNAWFGIWDTPMKIATGSRYRPLSTAGFLGNGNLLHNGVGGNVANGNLGLALGSSGPGSVQASFSRRQINAINYHSPEFAGFQVMAQYSSTNESSALTNAAAPTSKPRLGSLAATYTAGPLFVSASYERHKNFNPAGQAFGFGAGAYREGDDDAYALVAAYTFGPVRLGTSFHKREYEVADPTVAGANRESRAKAYAIYADWTVMGPHTLRAGYIVARDTKGNATVNVNNQTAPVSAATGLRVGDTGAKMYAVQYAYAFSKRTEFNFGYVKLDNEANSRYTLGGPQQRNTGQGVPAGTTGNRDQDAVVMGMVHRF